MGLVVTALSQNGDVSALRAALAAAGLPLDPIQVIAEDAAAGSLSGGLLASGLASGSADAELMISDSGTGVPGIATHERRRPFFRNESLPDRLGDLEIPESELDNYAEALHRGKSVIAYFAKLETIDRVVEAFRSDASLSNIRRF
ncbi:MAG: hypothetical protein WAJ85_14290 [Candidatus Baltobacteraceae bacterium]|jgi:hypothetical protein